MREADYQGVFEFSHELRRASIFFTPAGWPHLRLRNRGLRRSRCEAAYRTTNLAEYRNVCEEAEYTVQNRQWQDGATASRVLASSEEEW